MKTVLSEEEYMKRLGLILKRDFFPSLLEVQEQEIEFTEPEKLTISQFQSIYVTEDNSSFAELLSRENERKRIKFERVYGGPARLVDDPSKRLLLQESVEDDTKLKSTKNKALTWTETEIGIDDIKKPKINSRNTRFNDEEEIKVNIPDTPMFTFGTVVETPQRITNESNLNLNSNRFRVPSTPVREQLAHSLTISTSISNNNNNNRSLKSTKKAKYELSELKALTPKRETTTSTVKNVLLVKKHKK